MGVIILYSLWCAIPVFFFVVALWGKLEQLSNRERAQNPKDFFKNGVFVSIGVALAIVVDQYALEAVVNAISPTILPLGLCRVVLLPLILYIMAKIVGPTPAISISKAPRPTRNQKSGHDGAHRGGRR